MKGAVVDAVMTEVWCCVVERFDAALELSLDETPADTCQRPVRLGHVPLTAVAGTARLHTNRKV